MTDSPVQLLAISGSLRARSLNSVLLDAAGELLPPSARLTVYRGLGDLPHFNPDLDGADAPAPVLELRRLLRAADALLVSCPEYAHGVPGALKNAFDWLVSGVEIVAMPVAIINGSPHATHATASLAETLTTMAARVERDASRSIPLAGRLRSAAEIVADPELAGALRSVLGALVGAAVHARAEGKRLA